MISFSDLKNEIEQKEIEAWHKLIRILSHEVMNSVTPVTSLSETVRSLLTNDNGEAIAPEELDKARINDMILALDTVIRRSKGMLNFVEDYRKLTRLPAPHFEVISIKDLFRDVRQLMQATASEKNLVLHEDLQNKSLALKADRKMIEQILINLISNAIHALNDTPRGQITLSASVNESNLCLRVIDNGPGIDEDILPSIFIPFFFYSQRWYRNRPYAL
ncbi:MAG: ATP-binding protein [Owenweeksia sp.]|nr:ATP-binding protein [Owenweeksia sp.]